jgi:hypothetical protein
MLLNIMVYAMFSGTDYIYTNSCLCRLLHLSKPGVTTGVVSTASGAAGSLISRGISKLT